MEPVTPLDLHRLFIGDQPPLYFLEIIIRVVLIYGFAVLMLRFMGKRGQRQMSTFEYVVIIALGSATGDSMFYPEVPILYAWLVIVVIIFLNYVTATLQIHSKSVNSFLEGDPRMMIREGKIIKESLEKEKLRREELMQLLREHEIEDTGEIQYAFLERTGNLGLFRHEKKEKVKGESTYPDDCLE